MADEYISFDCATCHKAVANKIGYYSWIPCGEEDLFESPAVILVDCPICGNPSLLRAVRIDEYGTKEWTDVVREWPAPARCLTADEMPENIKKDVQDSIKSYNANIYSACVVLCGRALERICVAKTSEKTIYSGLKKLRENGIIDQRLYEWANALREQRNIGAHAGEEDVKKEDARDVLDFLIAICEYIFVLSKKFEDFKVRKASKAITPAIAPPAPPAPPAPQ